MDRILALIDKRIPAAAETIEAELLEKGLTALDMSLEVVSAAAELLNRPPRFKIVKIDQGKSPAAARKKIKAKLKSKPAPEKSAHKHAAKDYMAVRPDQADAIQAIVDLAKKEIYFHGLSTIARIERMISRRYPADQRLVRQVLLQINAFRWLDESAGWFAIQGIAKHGLPKAIDKVLAVAGEVAVTEMHAALSRNSRLWKEPLSGKSSFGILPADARCANRG